MGESDSQISGLEFELSQKDQTISALTERLEMVVEQLDRAHRSGGNSIAANSAPDLGGERKLFHDLQVAVNEWHDAQPTATLERVESQLAEMRDLLFRQFTGQAPTDTHAASSEMQAASLQDPTTRPEKPTPSLIDIMKETSSPLLDVLKQQDSKSDSAEEEWEALKSEILSSDGQSEPAPSNDTAQPAESVSFAQANVPSIGEMEPPKPVDFNKAEQSDLQAAIDSRDEYISFLVRMVQSSYPSIPTTDWKSLENAPEELTSRLEELESLLEEQLRLAEVNLALERARLGRLDIELKDKEKDLLHQLEEAASLLEAGASTSDESGRRWMRFLHSAKKSKTDSD